MRLLGTPSSRLARLVAAMALSVVTVACWTTGTAAQAPARTPSRAVSATEGTPGVTLLGQDATVTGPLSTSKFHLRVRLSGATTGDTLRATLYPQLISRTDFQASLHGKLQSVGYNLADWQVSALHADPAGGVDATAALADFSLTTGVYPVQLQLYTSSGEAVGNLISTYLVYVSPGWSLPKLSVSVTLPYGTAPALANGRLAPRLPRGQAATLSHVAAVLANVKGVPISLDVVPQTLAALADGTPADRTALTELAASAATNDDQVLPSPYVRLNLPAMLGAGLSSGIDHQISIGAQTLSRWFTTPTNQTWVLGNPLNSSVTAALADAGATQFVVPSQDLSAPPIKYQNNTFAYPTALDVPGRHVEVYGEDVGLQAHFTNGPNQALDAYQLLSELAMIDVEQPALARGVVVVPPAGWRPNPTFLKVLLHGLAGNQLLDPVTVSGLFAKVRPALGNGGTATRSLFASAGSSDSSDIAALSQAVVNLETQLRAYQSIAPSAHSVLTTAQQELLIVESADLSRTERDRLVSQLKTTLRARLDQVQLPSNISITLTSRRGAIPVTILNNSKRPVHVRLSLKSQKLGFDGFRPTNGTCTILGPSAEQCQLTLPPQALTMRIPVEARTSGVFGLSIQLQTPDGAVTLRSSQYTVRSTAISSVGIILIVAAVLFLAVWWIRQHRRRRRRKGTLLEPVQRVPQHRRLEHGEVSGT